MIRNNDALAFYDLFFREVTNALKQIGLTVTSAKIYETNDFTGNNQEGDYVTVRDNGNNNYDVKVVKLLHTITLEDTYLKASNNLITMFIYGSERLKQDLVERLSRNFFGWDIDILYAKFTRGDAEFDFNNEPYTGVALSFKFGILLNHR
jgi:hypothetical protein